MDNTGAVWLFEWTHLGDKLSSDHQALVSVDGTLCSELSHHELKDVIRASAHGLANFLKVDPERFLGSN